MGVFELIFAGFMLFVIASIIVNAFSHGMAQEQQFTGKRVLCPPHKWEYVVEGRNALQCGKCGGKPMEDLRDSSGSEL